MRIGPELLQDLLDRVEGSLAAAIGTADGLLVEGVRRRRRKRGSGSRVRMLLR